MEKVADKLDNINQTLVKILGVMEKPENPFVKTLTVAGVGVGILGIIQVIDTIVKWFGGGYGFTAYSRHSLSGSWNLHCDDCTKLEAPSLKF